jgi:hypothetical protein
MVLTLIARGQEPRRYSWGLKRLWHIVKIEELIAYRSVAVRSQYVRLHVLDVCSADRAQYPGVPPDPCPASRRSVAGSGPTCDFQGCSIHHRRLLDSGPSAVQHHVCCLRCFNVNDVKNCGTAVYGCSRDGDNLLGERTAERRSLQG